jgi:hypothetical protein
MSKASISEDFQVIVNRTIDLAGNWQILSVTRHGTIHSRSCFPKPLIPGGTDGAADPAT